MAAKANFNAYHNYAIDSLHQWDRNQVLTLRGLNLATAPEVHFSNKNMARAIVRQATMENHVVTVSIPNSLLQDPLRIYAHIGIYEGSTFTVVETVEIPVIPRARPCDYQIEDTDGEIYSFSALENALQNKASNARVDNIIANASSTGNNAELIDVRTALDGTVHGSAGTAVRVQAKTLQANIGDLGVKVFTMDPALFRTGSWNNDDLLATGEVWRVCTSGAVYLPYEARLHLADGFRLRGFWCDEAGKSVEIIHWTTMPFDIPAYKRIKIVIARVTEDTTEIADIFEFVTAVQLRSALRQELNVIEADARNMLSDEFYMDPADFVPGGLESWNGGKFNEAFRYRVATTQVHAFPYAVTMYARAGFRFAPNLYTDGVFTADGLWNTEYTFAAGQQFKLMIARVTEDTAETASVAEYVAGVYCRSVLKNEHEQIKENLKKAAFFPPENKEVYSVNHRGYNYEAPENTLPAFKLSKKNGFNFVETDVRWTADGIPVLLHDETINRTGRNADGSAVASAVNISDITYDQAQVYDFGLYFSETYKGTKLPTFAEFITLCRNLALHPYIEIEGEINAARAATLLQIVTDCGLQDNVTWISFTYESLLRIVEKYPKARVGLNCITSEGLTANQLTYAGKLKETGGNVFFHADTNSIAACVEMAKAYGLPLELWCPSTEAEILNLPTYVTGVTTDKLIAKDVLYNAYIE